MLIYRAMKDNIETEIKYQIKDPLAVRAKLRALGAKFVKKEFEQDLWLAQKVNGVCGFINPVRLRILKKGGLLTLKGIRLKSKYKKRLELEVRINDPKTLLKLFEKMRFVERRRIEKIRQTYLYKEASILLDKLPFMGYYVEIEGGPKKIEHIAKLLNLDKENGIKESYSDLFSVYKMIRSVKDPRYRNIALTFQSERSVRQS